MKDENQSPYSFVLAENKLPPIGGAFRFFANIFSIGFLKLFAPQQSAAYLIERFTKAPTLKELVKLSTQIVAQGELIEKAQPLIYKTAELQAESPESVVLVSVAIKAFAEQYIPDFALKVINLGLHEKKCKFVNEFVKGLEAGTIKSVREDNINFAPTNLDNNALIAIYDVPKGTSRAKKLLEDVDKNTQEVSSENQNKTIILVDYIKDQFPQLLSLLVKDAGKGGDYTGILQSGSFMLKQDLQFFERWNAHYALKEQFQNEFEKFVKDGMRQPEQFQEYLKGAATKVMDFLIADIKAMPEETIAMGSKPMAFSVKDGMDKNILIQDLEAKRGNIPNVKSLSAALQAPAQEIATLPIPETTPRLSRAAQIKEKRLSQTNTTLNV